MRLVKGLVILLLCMVFLGPSIYRLYERYTHPWRRHREGSRQFGYWPGRPGLEMLFWTVMLALFVILMRGLLTLLDLHALWF